jgi:predicted amidohydrolase YtcJ
MLQSGAAGLNHEANMDDADLILHNARITTLDGGRPAATALAASRGRIVA